MLLNKHNLQIVDLASSPREGRHTMTGLLVEKDKTIATDGCQLITVERPTVFQDDDFPTIPGSNGGLTEPATATILERDSVVGILKALPKKPAKEILGNTQLKFEGEGKSLQVFAATTDLGTANLMTCRTIEGNFPNHTEAGPRGEPIARTYLDLTKLKKLVSVLEGFNKERPVVKMELFETPERQRPVRFSGFTDQGQKWVAVFMPIRVEEEEPEAKT